MFTVVVAVAGIDPKKATLVGYKKMNTDNDDAPVVELGTLSPAPNLADSRFSSMAASMPSLLGQQHSHLFTGSMPDLNRSASLKEGLLKRGKGKVKDVIVEERDVLRRRLTLPSELLESPNKPTVTAASRGNDARDSAIDVSAMTSLTDMSLSSAINLSAGVESDMQVSDIVDMDTNQLDMETGDSGRDTSATSRDVNNGQSNNTAASSASDSSSPNDDNVQNGFLPSDSNSDMSLSNQHSNSSASVTQTVNDNTPTSTSNWNTQAQTTHTLIQTVIDTGVDSQDGATGSMESSRLNAGGAMPHVRSAPSMDSGVVSLSDTSLSNQTTVTEASIDNLNTNPHSNLQHTADVTSSSTSPVQQQQRVHSMGQLSLDHNDAPSTSGGDAAYMTSECTIMELLQEEYKLSQVKDATSTPTPAHRQARSGLGMRAHMGAPGRAIKALPGSKSSPEIGRQPGSSRKLVSPVADQTIRSVHLDACRCWS